MGLFKRALRVLPSRFSWRRTIRESRRAIYFEDDYESVKLYSFWENIENGMMIPPSNLGVSSRASYNCPDSRGNLRTRNRLSAIKSFDYPDCSLLLSTGQRLLGDRADASRQLIDSMRVCSLTSCHPFFSLSLSLSIFPLFPENYSKLNRESLPLANL